MKKLCVLCMLFTVFTFSSFAFSDSVFASRTTEGITVDDKTLTQGTYNYVSFRLHAEGNCDGITATAFVIMDYGVTFSVTGNGEFDKTKTGRFHNHGSDIYIYALAVITDEQNNSYAEALTKVTW